MFMIMLFLGYSALGEVDCINDCHAVEWSLSASVIGGCGVDGEREFQVCLHSAVME